MALTTLQYVDSVFYRVGRGAPEQQTGLWRTAIEAALQTALGRLGERVAANENPGERARLQKTFSLTLTTGDVAISAAMVTSTLPKAHLSLTGTAQPFCFMPQYQDLINPPPLADYYFWTIHENKIKVRTSLGAAPSATGLTVYCSYYPILSEVPDEFTTDLVDIGVELVLENQSVQEVEREGEEL